MIGYRHRWPMKLTIIRSIVPQMPHLSAKKFQLRLKHDVTPTYKKTTSMQKLLFIIQL